MLTETIESMCASFTTVLTMAEKASREQCIVKCEVLGRWVFVAPGDNPHRVYVCYFSDMVSRRY